MKGQSTNVELSPVAQFWYDVEAGSYRLEGEKPQRLWDAFGVFDEYRAARARRDVEAVIFLANDFRQRYKEVLNAPDDHVDWYLENPNLIFYSDDATGQEGWLDPEDPDRRLIPIDERAHVWADVEGAG